MHWRWLQVALVGLLAALMVPMPLARAHEVRPAYLQIDEVGPGRYQLLWRTPVLAGMRLPVVLRLPGRDSRRHRAFSARALGFPGRTPRLRRRHPGTGRQAHRVRRASGNRHRRAGARADAGRHTFDHAGATVRSRGSTSRRRRGLLRLPGPICRMASSTSCSASTTSSSCSGLFSSFATRGCCC